MKKIFTLLFMSLALAANANDFTDELAVNLNGNDLEPSEVTVSVTQQENGNYTFTLPNFILSNGEEGTDMNVGTINITDIEGTDMGNGLTRLSTTQDITIEAGDDPNISFWYGTILGKVPVEMNALMTEDKLNVDITIAMGEMPIVVAFGTPFVDEYAGTLEVSTGGNVMASNEDTMYITTQTDGKYTVTLKNFGISLVFLTINVGTVNIADVEGVVDDDGNITLSSEQDVAIVAGDDDSINWYGPGMGDVPVTLSATLSEGTLTAEISITMSSYGTYTVNFNGSDVTGIQSVPATTTTAKQNSGSYTLTGVKAPAGYKGIVIENGRKVIK